MRSGTCTVQQTLTAEAASVLKHSLSLARRRGHAQVTPLHVAATLLSSRSSLLRRACLKSQPLHQSSYPLQCRALELCFNVALNRLPTTPSPLLHGQPSLSNALIAALKRAQAHQRRGCIEQQQQQPLLTIKVELEQLIISILDDPSVSRVMREAGFSSTCVKNNIEDSSASSVFHSYTSSAGVFSSPCSPSAENQREIINPATFWQTHFLSYSSEKSPIHFSPQKKVLADSITVKEDIKLVFEVFLSKKRKNTVVVGDCVSITEGLASELMGRVERGEVPLELKQTQFVKFQFAPVALRLMKKEDVEMNITQLKKKVDSMINGEGGAIIYAGDLKWTVEEIVGIGNEGEYNPVDHLVREMGRIVSDYSSSNTKVWLMATASYQTYMRCQMRHPPLEIQWALQTVSVPSGGLGLSLHGSSIQESRISFCQNPSPVVETKPFFSNGKDEQEKLSCCAECTASYEKEAQLFKSTHNKNLPPWVQAQVTNTNQKDQLMELRRKWNGLCQGLNHQGRNLGSILYHKNSNQVVIGRRNAYVSSYPYCSTQLNNVISDPSNSISFTDSGLKPHYTSNFVPKFRRQQSCTIDFNFGNETQKRQPNLDSLKNTQGKELKITLALGNSFFSETEKWEKKRSDLCKLLQENVPWQSETVDSLVDVLVESKPTGKGIWLTIQGNDTIGKRRLALAVAESLLGSADLLLHLNMRKTENEVAPYSDTITRALRTQEKLVALVEYVDFADTQFLKFLVDGFETGKFGETETIGQAAIFILTRGGDLMKNQDFVIQMKLEVKETKTANCSKRKAEWETLSNQKIEKEDGIKNAKKKRMCFSRQSNFNTLDLNIKADEDCENEEKPKEFSSISSNSNSQTKSDPVTPHGFLDLIKNKFVFDRNQDDQHREIREVLYSKMNKCFEQVFGEENRRGFSIEEKVIEEIIDRYGWFINSKIDRWVKDILQTSFKTVKNGGKEGVEVRLCFEGQNGIVLENGYMGSSLPKKIQVSLMD